MPEDVRLPDHVVLESYSVLTRLPPPHRAPAGVVEEFLARRFPGELLLLPGNHHRTLVGTSADGGITGGAVYDALVAATAKHAGATLLTRDRRATRTYEAVGVRYRLVG